MQDDHDFYYYVLHGGFKGIKPFVFGVDAVYFRDRSNLTPALGTAGAVRGQQTDSFLVMPSVSGNFGFFTFLLQPMVIFGTVDSGINAAVPTQIDLSAGKVPGRMRARRHDGGAPTERTAQQYYFTYIDRVPHGDICRILDARREEMMALMRASPRTMAVIDTLPTVRASGRC